MRNDQVIIDKDVFIGLRGDPSLHPDVSIVIPVNANSDLIKVQYTLNDIAGYKGKHRIEIVLVINNFPEQNPPVLIDEFRSRGLVIEAVPQILTEEKIKMLTERLYGPNVVRSNTLTSARSLRIFTGRILGSKAASSENLIHFDSDCRVADATALIDWYVSMFQTGASLAYTHVDYFELPASLAAKFYLMFHHLFRWFKRVVLGIPTSRGSNYAVLRTLFIELHEHKNLNADNKVGPSFKQRGWKIAYNPEKKLTVFTSGRDFVSSWDAFLKYLVWRIHYYWKRRSLGPGSQL